MQRGCELDAVILAGGRCEPGLAEFAGLEFRADIPYEGRSMLEIVRSALSDFGEPIIVGGPDGASSRQVAAGKTFIDSVKAGLSQVATETFFLSTVDLPCLTREIVADYLSRCDLNAALNYPIIDTTACEAKFPGMKRTSLRLREGVFTGGNVAVMKTELMERALPVLERAYQYRKSPVKLARLVGLGTLSRIAYSKLAPKSLPLSQLEVSVGRFLGVPIKAVQTPFAEIGADIDNLAQYQALLALSKSNK